MLDLFTNKFPYTDLHELNLDWIISRLIQMDHKLTNFVSLNTIKYADPIEWNIASQYGTNTVVVDPATGIAYLSTQPVPAGVSIGDTAYWTEIFNLQQIIGNITDNLTLHNNGQSPTLLFTVSEGDWILWNNKLYVATADMIAGTALIVGSNIDEANVEDLTKAYTDALAVIVGTLANLNTSDKTSIVNAINSLLSDLSTVIGDLNDLNTTDKTSVVNAINSALTEINTIIGSLADLNTSDKISIVNAINEVLSNVGDLSLLNTTDKSSAVAAINELENRIDNLKQTIYINVKDYGAVGDGVTDDTDAIDAALAIANSDKGMLFFPAGRYLITRRLYFYGDGTGIIGEGNHATYLLFDNNDTAIQIGNGINAVHGFYMANVGVINWGGATTYDGININYSTNSTFFNLLIEGFYCAIRMMRTGNSYFYTIGITSRVLNARGFIIGDHSVSTAILNSYCSFSGDALDTAYGISASIGRIADLLVQYFDQANGLVGIYMNGSNWDNYPSTDIRLLDIVVDGSRYACIQLEQFSLSNGVLIQGGWLNPTRTAGNACIRLTNAYNVTVTGVHMQQLNTVDAPCLYGIIASHSQGLQVVNNRFTNMLCAVSLSSSTVMSIISNNSITQPVENVALGASDIAIDTCGDVVIESNVSNTKNAYFITKTGTSNRSLVVGNISRIKTSGFMSGTGTGDVVDNNITS